MSHEKILAYLHNELPGMERKEFEERLQNDPLLKAQFDETKSLSSSLDQNFEVPGNLELSESQRNKILEAADSKKKKKIPMLTEYILLAVVLAGMVLMFKPRVEKLISGQMDVLEGKVNTFD